MNKGTELIGKIGHINNPIEKEFEALDDLFDLVHSQESFEKGQKCYDILKDALIELKVIKETDPNEALEYMKTLFECWKNLAEKANLETKEIELEKYVFEENYDTIKNYILKTQEKNVNTNIIDNYMAFKNNDINSSEALKSLEKLGHLDLYESCNNLKVNEVDEFGIVKQALVKAQNDKKLLKVINEKNVDIVELKRAKTVEEYNLQMCGGISDPLNKDEFDALKEWSKYE